MSSVYALLLALLYCCCCRCDGSAASTTASRRGAPACFVASTRRIGSTAAGAFSSTAATATLTNQYASPAAVLATANGQRRQQQQQRRRILSSQPQTTLSRRIGQVALLASEKNDGEGGQSEEEAERLKQQAEQLRDQIRQMEEQLDSTGGTRSRQRSGAEEEQTTDEGSSEMSLTNKRVLVVGANGRLGSMVCRELLRRPGVGDRCQVTALVHLVSENSPTARGYARLSYEVGAEDGIGSIGAAWNADERTASFTYDAETMSGYNLQNLRVVECELFDQTQCQTIVDEVKPDTIIYCATDFNKNQPRAAVSLNAAFLFRALTNTNNKSERVVDLEGVQNLIAAMERSQRQENQQSSIFGRASTTNNSNKKTNPINFVLVSNSPEAFGNTMGTADFVTPGGSFLQIKRQAEGEVAASALAKTTVLQMSRYDDMFVDEGAPIQMDVVSDRAKTVSATTIAAAAGRADGAESQLQQLQQQPQIELDAEKSRRCINRRDAAKAIVDSLTDEECVDKTLQIWTTIR